MIRKHFIEKTKLAPRSAVTQIARSVRMLRQRARAEWDVHNALRADAPPILVYQMGKVGSSTVRASLQGAGLSRRVLSTHFLSDQLPEIRRRRVRAGLYPYHIEVGIVLRRYIGVLEDRGCKVVSLVRDPIEREVSNLFQNPRLSADVKDESGTFNLRRVLSLLHQRLRDPDTFRYAFDWFERELETTLGIDVFSSPFAIDRGWTIYRSGNIEALILRLEDLTSTGPDAISQFLELPQALDLVSSNVRSEKVGGDSYRWVRNRLRLDRAVCETIYSSRFVKHFYNDRMIEQFLQKWSG